jgi:hypothetical protein
MRNGGQQRELAAPRPQTLNVYRWVLQEENIFPTLMIITAVAEKSIPYMRFTRINIGVSDENIFPRTCAGRDRREDAEKSDLSSMMDRS